MKMPISNGLRRFFSQVFLETYRCLPCLPAYMHAYAPLHVLPIAYLTLAYLPDVMHTFFLMPTCLTHL